MSKQPQRAGVGQPAFVQTAPSLPVVVIHTVGLVGLVHNEGGPLQRGTAHHAGEALRMVRVTSGLQHPVGDGLFANAALFQGSLGPKKTGEDTLIQSLTPRSLRPRQARREEKGKARESDCSQLGSLQQLSPSDSQRNSPHRRASHPRCRTAAPAAASHI